MEGWPLRLFFFGHGYVAAALARALAPRGFAVAGTHRSEAAATALAAQGHGGYRFDGTQPVAAEALDGITHMLVSIPPDDDGDPVLRHHRDALAERAQQFAWVGYLSTTGVYGDRAGDWVDESSPLQPVTARGQRRVAAEARWRELKESSGLPVHIFRLAGIYGPQRNQLEAVRSGTARRIVKPGQVFSRVHVDDIVGVLRASMARPRPGAIYNVCDDEPAPPQDVVAHAARLLGREPPPEIPFEAAALTPMARSFFGESKRVSNRLVKEELGYRFRHPSYREGLEALVEGEEAIGNRQ
jgi:nucleoside-diphosphate-sugar epimerase